MGSQVAVTNGAASQMIYGGHGVALYRHDKPGLGSVMEQPVLAHGVDLRRGVPRVRARVWSINHQSQSRSGAIPVCLVSVSMSLVRLALLGLTGSG